MRRALLITTLLFALLALVVRLRAPSPSPLPVDAPKELFSAERARLAQRTLSAEATRTCGSVGNQHGRSTLSAELERAGFRVERQKTVSCTYHGFCAPIENVIATLEGREPNAPGILLVAHHDSVPVSPGASDDGAGSSAIVEVARAIGAGPTLRHLVVVLLTDGEEDGLLGADAFARESPWAARVKAVINVDARGSSGASQMFETSRGNAWLVDALATHVTRPSTSSLFYEVYKRMPNDTDFTVLKHLGSGVNFANIARIEHYHTPLDDVSHASLSTLQHHGDNALGMVRAFDGIDIANPPRTGDATWFDVLGLVVVRWPEKLTLPLALFVLVLACVNAVRFRAWDVGLTAGIATLSAGALAAVVVGSALKVIGALPAPWIAHPGSALVALHLGAAGAMTFVAYVLRSASPRSLWAGVWVLWSLIGAAAAATAPGTSFLFVVPALVATLVAFVSLEASCIAGAATSALLFFPLASAVHDALGFVAPPAAAVPTILVFPTLVPLLGGISKRAPRALLGAALLALVTAVFVPKFSEEVPARANVVFRQEETGDAKVFIDTVWGPTAWGEAPKPMVGALGDPKALGRESPFSWTLPALYAATPRIDAPLPEAEVRRNEVEGGHRKVTLRVRSARDAPVLALVLPGSRAINVKVSGKHALPRFGYVVGLKGFPKEGVEVELDATGTEPLAVTLLDRTWGVPKGTIASATVAARPVNVTQTQDGDVTVVQRALTF